MKTNPAEEFLEIVQSLYILIEMMQSTGELGVTSEGRFVWFRMK